MKWVLPMNEIILPYTKMATTSVFFLSAALAAGNTEWPVHKPIYSINQSSPTFSSFKASCAAEPKMTVHDFAQEISQVFASLSEDQEPLGSEFEAVWDENLDVLYQS